MDDQPKVTCKYCKKKTEMRRMRHKDVVGLICADCDDARGTAPLPPKPRKEFQGVRNIYEPLKVERARERSAMSSAIYFYRCRNCSYEFSRAMSLSPGSNCPYCNKGQVYKDKDKTQNQDWLAGMPTE
jgi:predicted Zn-ribbon and HTH transcriptional regulator